MVKSSSKKPSFYQGGHSSMPTVTSSCARSRLRLWWSARAPTRRPRRRGVWLSCLRLGKGADDVQAIGDDWCRKMAWLSHWGLGGSPMTCLKPPAITASWGWWDTQLMFVGWKKIWYRKDLGLTFADCISEESQWQKKTQFWSSQWHLMTSSQRNSWPVLVSPYFSWIMTSTARSEIKIIMILYQWYHGRRKQLIFHMILASHFCDKKTRIIFHPMIPMGVPWGFPLIPGTSQTLSCLPSGSIPGGLGQPDLMETDGNCGNS